MGALSYSDAGAELDAIIEEFETGVIDVDRLVEQLQRATDIVDELDRRLRRTRIQVEELVPRLEAIGQHDVAVVEVVEVDIDEEPAFDNEGEPPPPTTTRPRALLNTVRAVANRAADGRQWMLRSRSTQYGWRSSRLSTLPDGLRGSTSMKSTDVGHL